MSSTTVTTTTVMDRRTYWCHECDMSISLLPTSSLCPHCNSDFLEELDSPITFTNPNPNPNSHGDSDQLLFPSFLDPSLPADAFQFPAAETPADTLDNPYFHRRNSCPVCRFQLPVDPVDGDSKVRRRSRSRVLRLGDLVDDEDDEELLGFGLRHLARRHRLVFPIRHQRERRVGEVEGEVEALFSSTQIGEEVQVDVMPDSGRTNSVETVSSWPSWPVDGGEIAARVNDDDDVVMS
ncbi:putative E3 ubiquitin-protein ligase RNF126-like, zinc-ribbon [Helianthus annuus]|nr:putative E3 ubiquitin-protein ligase RNF126-like, zinc-ribbon [Helianthus annuus]